MTQMDDVLLDTDLRTAESSSDTVFGFSVLGRAATVLSDLLSSLNIVEQDSEKTPNGLHRSMTATGALVPQAADDVRVAPWSRRLAVRLAVSDTVMIVLAGLGLHLTQLGVAGVTGRWSVTALVVAAWLLALRLIDSRDPRLIGHGPDEYKRVVQATLAVFGVLATSSFLFHFTLSRGYVAFMMLVGLAGILSGRFVWRRWLHRRRACGDMMTRVLAVGDRRTVSDLIDDLERSPMAGFKVIGACVPDGGSTAIRGVPVVGSLNRVAATVRATGVDTVAVTASGAFGADDVRELSWSLEDTETDLVLAPALTNIAGPRILTQPVAGLPLIHVDKPSYREANKVLKRSFDLVVGTFLLLLGLPLIAAVAVAVKTTSKGPVFFRQVRVGLEGESFRMIKFRSMVVDAEEQLAVLKQTRVTDGNEVLYKLRNDPRITPVGRWIRRLSLDELPQLFNVLLGHMSLVGPRPPLLAEVELYGDRARRRLLVKPGMTGLWQVSGRSDLGWEETVRLDVYYVENWSITSDLVILWKTVKAVVASSGAY